MVAEVLKPNVQDLQTDVIDLLEQISELMNRASTALSSDTSGNKYAEFEEQIRAEAKKVKHLVLRMAIVAPMKAGKSTITNAIVGQEILPSRNSAMTTLSTEITFNAQFTEPVLHLSQDILSVFKETLSALRNKIESLGLEQVQEKLAQYPHLANMPQEIKQSGGLKIPTKSIGRDQIIHTLTNLNDIVRLCSIIAPGADPIQYLTDTPKIETHFWRLEKTEEKQPQLGTLVIVDTPGPNEAGENLRLQTVVAEQLRQSSIVLIVLDFTQLKNEAAEKVKTDVQKVIELRGKDNLYVLINKVDQRRKGDMTPEEVQQFVAAEFGIGDGGDFGRVFEISARRAFTAASFLLELQHNPNINLADMKTAKALAQEALGSRWEAKLQKTIIKDLEEEAHYLWDESGFDPFLNDAITALMKEAAPRCIKSALKVAHGHLVALKNDVKICSSAVNKDASKIKNEIRLLNTDLKNLESCLHEIKLTIKKQKNSLNKKLDSIFNDLIRDTETAIQNYFLDGILESFKKSKNSNNPLDSISELDIKIRKFFVQKVHIPGLSEIFPESLSRILKYQVGLSGRNELEFKTKHEAEDFTEQVIAEANKIVENLLNKSLKEIEIEIQADQQDVNSFLQKGTRIIIENARNRLNRAFDIELELPPLLLDEMENNFGFSIEICEGERPFDIVKTVVNFFKKLFSSKNIEKEENIYLVSLEQTVFQFNFAIKIKIEDTKNQINQYLNTQCQEQISKFVEELNDYLESYKISLSKTLENQSLSLSEQDKFKEYLKYLSNTMDGIDKEIKQKQVFAQNLLSAK
jgi:GTPase Era involved in 16S rRNA processing